MKKTPYLESKAHKISKYVLAWTFILLILCLMGCAKNASESAAETSLNQLHVIQQKIEKECATADFDKEIKALESSIKNQLEICETQKGTLRERNNTLIVILIGIALIFGISKWAKIQKVI